jgi:hypothetical protein
MRLTTKYYRFWNGIATANTISVAKISTVSVVNASTASILLVN